MATSRNVLKDIPEVKSLDDVHALLAQQHLDELRRLRRARRSKIVNSASGLLAVIIISADGMYRIFGGELMKIVHGSVELLIFFAFIYFLQELIVAIYNREA